MRKWAIAVDGPVLSFDEVFGAAGLEGSDTTRDTVLDIGFGGGEALIELAEMRPHERVIGVDVHTPGIAAVLEAIENRGLLNVRVVAGDVIDFADRIPLGSLSAIRAFFPDPWPKQRQRGRRLIRPEVLQWLVPLLRVGGTLHLATDSDDYAAQMRRVCDAEDALVGGIVERPSWRPSTRFELRARDEGRRATELIYMTSESSASESSSALR